VVICHKNTLEPYQTNLTFLAHVDKSVDNSWAPSSYRVVIVWMRTVYRSLSEVAGSGQSSLVSEAK